MSVYGDIRNSTVAPVGEMVAGLLRGVWSAGEIGIKAAGALGRNLAHRRAMAQLTGLDDRMLRDIGLTRADLRDATAAPFFADPTRVLVLRATERRTGARLARRDKAV